MYKFSGFNEKGNTVLNQSIFLAEQLGHAFIGTEHILTALIEDEDSLTAKVLSKKSVKFADMVEILKKSIGEFPAGKLSPEDFNPSSKNIIQYSIDIARSQGLSYTGSEHLFLAMINDSEGVASYFLSKLGVNAEDLIREINGANENFEDAPRMNSKGKAVSDTPTLDKFGRDLTELARQNKIDPVIGRDKEIQRVIQILSRRTKNNPVLIGEPGVGKTAIAEGLALKIAQGEVPEILKEKRIVSLDLNGMLAGTKFRGEFEERIQKVIEEVKASSSTMLFIDEIHSIVGAGSAEGSADAGNILKPSLARGEMQIIGATTINEYRKYIEKDAALERRFQPIIVDEPTQEDSIKILKGLRDKYEAHHKVKISDEAIEAAVEMSSRYIGDRFLPDKAIDLIDEAASRLRLKAVTAPTDLKQIEDRLSEIASEKDSAINNQDFEKAAEIRDEENDLKKKLEDKKSKWKEFSTMKTDVVSKEDIAEVVSAWTSIPVIQLTETESQRLLHMEDEMHERIIGQNEAVSAVSRAIRRSRVGLKDPKRPIGSFIFLGPTGVGKTELCKALAVSMFGDENAMIRFDMSEYMEKHTTSKLIGSPPGYVGYDEGGQLTDKIRRRPYSVILFDEIEKAHPDIFNMLLQILDDGVLTDSQGIKVDFKNTIIIMTSNVGANLIVNSKNSLGFSGIDKEEKTLSEEEIRSAIMRELKNMFRPEFLNRIDDIIVFQKLSEADIEKIASNLLKGLSERIAGMDILVDFSKNILNHVAEIGYDPTYGARPLKRAIASNIEDKLAEYILEGKVKAGGKYIFDFDLKEKKVLVKET